MSDVKSPYDDYCYECEKHGDDYRLDDNGELVRACDDCPFNDLGEVEE